MKDSAQFCINVITEYQAPWLLPYSSYELQHILQEMLLAQAKSGIGSPILGIDLYLVNDSTIRQTNLQFMQCPGVTNILSFPGGEDLAGSLMLSLDTLERESLLYGQPLSAYTLRLLAHGLAHLAQLEHGEEHDKLSYACETAAKKIIRKFKSSS
ncbi:MAG: rRNA maturation RNase YbeY [Desulfovibrionaceae bacterium]|nr:rRNA maturation RNase YbeY [Desulfovibrionaceae bacterium]